MVWTSNLTIFIHRIADVQLLLCDAYTPYRAPQGCLQYFTGVRSTVKSFNWDGTTTCTTGCLLGSQQYAVCFRPEQGNMLQGFSIQRKVHILLLIFKCNYINLYMHIIFYGSLYRHVRDGVRPKSSSKYLGRIPSNSINSWSRCK